MSESTFVLETKSTLDKIAKDLSVTMGIDYVDVDDTVNAAAKLTGVGSVLVWRFMSMEEDPMDPMYSLLFAVGVKTTSDPSNYDLLGFVSQIKATFKKGTWLDVLDYSTASVPDPLTPEGSILFTDSGVDPQVMDRESGVRMLTVSAKCQRFV